MLCKLTLLCLVIIIVSHFVYISTNNEIKDLIIKLGDPTIENLEKLVYHFRMSNYVSKNTNIWRDESIQCMNMENLCKNLSISSCNNKNKLLNNNELYSMLPGMVISSLEKTCTNESLSFYQKNKAAVWGYTFGFITLINLCALLGIFFSPLLNKKYFNLIIMMAVSLAVGILSSNSLFNLIPDAFGFDPLVNTDFLYKSLIIISSIYFFFAFETISKIIFMISNANKTNHTFHDLHSHHGEIINTVYKPNKEQALELEQQQQKSSETNSIIFVQPTKKIATIAWLIIIGDAIHNFADGLAIGSAFCISLQDGVTTSISVLLEELPHEIGDFAILLNSGMTLRQAAFYNFLSACSCYIGNIFGIITGSTIADGTRYISAFAGGLFLYISLVNILPECTEKCILLSQGNWRLMSFYSLLSYLMMISGIAFMFFTALYSINI